MPVVTSGTGGTTNLVTRSPDEIAAQSGPFGTRSQTASGGSADPAAARSFVSGLLSGGLRSAAQAPTAASSIQFGTASAGKEDWRIKVSVTKGSAVLYDDPNPGIMAPLVATNGVIFPYVPAVTVSHAAKYSTQSLTHTNYSNYFYESSEVSSINIVADFTVQNTYEAQYFLASVYFFRAATKMFYGESTMYQGAPPPIVYLDGYGAHYLPHVSCVVTGFSHTMPSDVDYLEVSVGPSYVDSSNVQYDEIGNPSKQGPSSGGPSGPTATRVPTSSQFSITLQPVYSRTNQKKFSFDAFARGDLIMGAGRTAGYL